MTNSKHPAARFRLFVVGLALTLTPLAPLAADTHRAVDVVICLDTSGSMDSLLDSVRARLWDVLVDLGRLQPTPNLRVGLVAYGTSLGRAEGGWVLVKSDLTNDLDAVYAELMALEIGGRDEYVGKAVRTAIDEMSWSRGDDDLRVIFIAGNEPIDQGDDPRDLRVAAKAAEAEGILVNALYAGPREQAIAEGWPSIARVGKGNFSAIDASRGTVQIETPQDETLMELNDRLNMTYVPYGERGRDGFANQVAQDMNTSRLGVESCSSRIVAKGMALYNNASWDLVDAALEAEFDWSRLSSADLPEEMHEMTLGQRQAYVGAKRREREAVQQMIQEVSEEREVFLRRALTGGEEAVPDLGDAMRDAIRLQARAKGFES